MKVNTKRSVAGSGKKKDAHNSYAGTNRIRFLGYNLSHQVAPLCLYGGQSK